MNETELTFDHSALKDPQSYLQPIVNWLAEQYGWTVSIFMAGEMPGENSEESVKKPLEMLTCASSSLIICFFTYDFAVYTVERLCEAHPPGCGTNTRARASQMQRHLSWSFLMPSSVSAIQHLSSL